MTPSPVQKIPVAGLFHLGVLYLVWGSTYLAFRLAVGPGGDFQPLWLGALRLLPAALLLLGFALLRGLRVRLTVSEATRLLVSGVLLWALGNGLVLVASQHAYSGYAALMVGATPLWVAGLEAFLNRRLPSPLLITGLLIGLLGVGVLSAPHLDSGSASDLRASVMLFFGPIFWGAGLVYMQRRAVALDPLVVSGYQQLFGGITFVLLIALFGEAWTAPSTTGWWSWLYLLIFGSLIAYTSFVLALRLLPANLVATYAYVNPVIAVFLGWLILREPLSLWTLAGACLVLLGVAFVFRGRLIQK